MKTLILELPKPPSLNDYYGHRVLGRGIKSFVSVYIKKKGVEYRKEIDRIIKPLCLETLTNRLTVVVEFFPARNGKCDLDNFTKCLFDALTHSNVYEDDSLIDSVVLMRRPKIEGGKCIVTIKEHNETFFNETIDSTKSL